MDLDRRLALGAAGGSGWADGIERLLRLAFAGPSLVAEIQAQTAGGDPSSRSEYPEGQIGWLKQLRSELDQAQLATPPKYYWSQRSGGQPDTLNERAVMDRFVYLVEELVDAGLWAESFGLECPDGVGDPAKPPDVQIEDMIGHRIGGRGDLATAAKQARLVPRRLLRPAGGCRVGRRPGRCMPW
jgi:hypothetical protein